MELRLSRTNPSSFIKIYPIDNGVSDYQDLVYPSSTQKYPFVWSDQRRLCRDSDSAWS